MIIQNSQINYPTGHVQRMVEPKIKLKNDDHKLTGDLTTIASASWSAAAEALRESAGEEKRW